MLLTSKFAVSVMNVTFRNLKHTKQNRLDRIGRDKVLPTELINFMVIIVLRPDCS
jgi:hypothetical protein